MLRTRRNPPRAAAAGMLLLRFFWARAADDTVAETDAEAAAEVAPFEVFVDAAKGTDNAAGTLAAPLRTVHAAQQRVQRLPRPLVSDCFITLRAGSYYANKTLGFYSAADGGSSPNARVVYRTHPPDVSAGHRAILSAGRELRGFTKNATSGFWQLKVPDDVEPFQQLYIAGQRKQRARMPKVGLSERGLGDDSTFKYSSPLRNCTGSTWSSTCPEVDKWGFVFKPGDFKSSWKNIQDIQVLVFHAWTAFWSDVQTVHDSNNTVIFQKQASKAVGAMAMQGGHRYMIENVFEGLDEEGEWYFDKTTRNLHYLQSNISDADANSIVAVVPQRERILYVGGASASKPVSYVKFQDIAFRHSAEVVRTNTYLCSHTALLLENCKGIDLERVDISMTGANGIYMSSGVKDITIESSRVSLTGGEGISMGQAAADAARVLVNNTIVRDTALTVLGQPASIRLRGAADIRVQYCDVSRNPYGAILAGWQKGISTPQPATTTPIFTVQYNRVYDYGMGILSDFAGIYLSSDDNLCFEPGRDTCSLPSLIYNNVISGSRSYNYGGEGIYMDEQVSSVHIKQNLIYDLAAEGVYFHCGKNNTAEGNIMAFLNNGAHATLSRSGVIGGCNGGGNPTWPNISHGFFYHHNIHWLCPNHSTILSGLDYRDTHFDQNIYWSPDALARSSFMFENRSSFKHWQATGQDLHSKIVDPKFKDPSVGSYDFELSANSPALPMGIVGVDTTAVGVHGNPFSVQ